MALRIEALAWLAIAWPLHSQPAFEEIPPKKSRITWTHDAARSERRYLPETLGPGVAFLDYDGDGWMDVFFVNSGPSDFYRPKTPPRHALYRNERDGTFTDVTARAGLAGGHAFGMGVAAGDYDNNGFPDLFVSAYGQPTLYRNNADGTFTDVTASAGIAIGRWTTSALWFDYDGDGRLDLFAAGFVDYRRESQQSCVDARGGKPGYCIPRIFKAGASYLFRNEGGGTFRDVSAETRIAARPGKALGAVATDIDNDGRMDLFVANDTVENFLFMNRGSRFEDVGVAAMVGLGHNGMARSGMGVDAADIDGDGKQDLFVANIDQEMFSLYRNTGYGVFDDLAFAGEIGRATYDLSGWGAKLFDIDNDGAIDLFLANGHPDDLVSERRPRVTYQEPMLLFRQQAGQFRNVSSTAGPVFSRPVSARGLAAGDYDNDGRVDVLVGVNGGAPILLRNRSGESNRWVGIMLRGAVANRDGTGARIRWSAGGKVRERLKTAGGSYLSAHDPREVLALGNTEAPDWIEVHWPAPSRRVERFRGIRAGRYTVLAEGKGEAPGF